VLHAHHDDRRDMHVGRRIVSRTLLYSGSELGAWAKFQRLSSQRRQPRQLRASGIAGPSRPITDDRDHDWYCHRSISGRD
jgi:hypothetical protein